MNPSQLKVAFLDVGQGDATVVILPRGDENASAAAIVVDCPPTIEPVLGYLTDERVVQLPYVVVTHSDSDHIGGVSALLRNYLAMSNARLGCVAYHNDTIQVGRNKNRATLLRSLLQVADRYGEDTRSPTKGDQWNPAPGVRVDVLHPSDKRLKAVQLLPNPNNASVLLRISYADYRFLLPGDLQGKGWEWVCGYPTDLRAHFLRFPHHGAWYEAGAHEPDLSDILRQIDPAVVIISVGSNNPYGHPHPQSVDLLCSMPTIRFAHTQPTTRSVDSSENPWPRQFSDSGTVEIVVDSSGFEVFVLDAQGARARKIP